MSHPQQQGNIDFPGILGPESQKDTKYIRQNPIGAGSFAEAWVVTRRSDGKQFAAKIMFLRSMDHRAQQRAKSEVSCLQSCQHFACLSFVEHFEMDNRLLIIVEFCNAGDLASYIQGCKTSGRPFPESTVSIILLQLVLALNHMHRKKILHRDIKSKNVFLSTTGLVKVGDFGLSNEYETVSGDVAQTFCGTPYYLAPEVWRRERYGVKADIWALGVLTYEIITGQCPFTGSDMQGLLRGVLENPYPPIPPNRVSSELVELVDMMLQKDPTKRPNTMQLLRVPYLRRALMNFVPTVNNTDRVAPEMKTAVAGAVKEVMELLDQPEAPTPAELAFEGPVRKKKGEEMAERYLVLRGGGLEVLANAHQPRQRRPLPLSCVKEVVADPSNPKLFDITTLDGHAYTFESEVRDQWVNILGEALGVVDNR